MLTAFDKNIVQQLGAGFHADEARLSMQSNGAENASRKGYPRETKGSRVLSVFGLWPLWIKGILLYK